MRAERRQGETGAAGTRGNESAAPWRSRLYVGRVVHERLRPFRHRFAYPVLYGLFDLDELPALGAGLRCFGHNAPGLFSVWDRDHGPRDGSPLRPWIDSHLKAMGLALDGGPIRLLCLPRQFGYAFNPLSVWFCHDRDETLKAVLYEVRNTFGQAHGYLIPIAGGERGGTVRQDCAKTFHVSPFLEMGARYRFRLRPPDGRLSLSIREEAREEADEGAVMVATLTGTARSLGDRQLLGAALRRPLGTLAVTAAIHWQALRLWYKGARVVPRPAPPAAPVSYVRRGFGNLAE